MYYCSECQRLSDEKQCRVCGKKNLHDVQEEDFCLLTEQEEMWAKMFLEVLKDQKIPSTHFPVYGSGFTMRTGTVERYKIYVPYGRLEEASRLLQELLAE